MNDVYVGCPRKRGRLPCWVGVPLLTGKDGGHSHLQVVDEVDQLGRGSRPSSVSEAVFHVRGKDSPQQFAVDEAVALKGLQRLGQPLLADPVHPLERS